MTKPVSVTDAEFASEVLASDKPVLVDFWAPWCGPCRMIAPVLEELAHDHQDTLKVVKIDTDKHHAVAMQHEVMSIPTLILFKDGAPVQRLVGFMSKSQLESKVLPLLESNPARR